MVKGISIVVNWLKILKICQQQFLQMLHRRHCQHLYRHCSFSRKWSSSEKFTSRNRKWNSAHLPRSGFGSWRLTETVKYLPVFENVHLCWTKCLAENIIVARLAANFRCMLCPGLRGWRSRWRSGVRVSAVRPLPGADIDCGNIECVLSVKLLQMLYEHYFLQICSLKTFPHYTDEKCNRGNTLLLSKHICCCTNVA